MSTVLALNAGKTESGELQQETMDRADAAMEHAITNGADRVIMVGGDAQAMLDYAAERFTHDAVELVAESDSQDTLEGAHRVKVDYLQPNNPQEVEVFTSDFTEPRTRWIFSAIVGNTHNVRIHSVPSGYSPEKMRRVQRREKVQLAVAKLKLLGIRPEDDDKRERRLPRFRYRDKENPIGQLLVLADGLTNPRIPASVKFRDTLRFAGSLTSRLVSRHKSLRPAAGAPYGRRK